jgi:hypothetical protein
MKPTKNINLNRRSVSSKKDDPKYASPIEQIIHQAVLLSGKSIKDICEEANIDRWSIARIARGISVRTTTANAILNSIGCRLAVVKIKDEKNE